MGVSGKTEGAMSRRNLLTGCAALLAGGGIGSGLTAFAGSNPGAAEAPAGVPPLPWKWATLDPLEAGRRAYRLYIEKGAGCGTASYLSLLSLLQEKVGHPWTTLPEMLMSHAQAGYAGHGTLCGALGGVTTIINLATYDEKADTSRQIIDRLFWWYAEQEFPTDRFDDISSMPKQVKVKAQTPLCHSSVSSWTLAAGAEVTSKAKKERCAKVCGEVVFTVVNAGNEYFAGRWSPPVWKPSKQTEHCVQCHGPDDMWQTGEGMNHQQGHMECLLCHTDHTT
ncbi:MAG: hypothetical protein C3F15_00625 [Holophagae bacterium]|nr:MAG: hypothetical protein C3F15_00625 [Holophagae bacterium]